MQPSHENRHCSLSAIILGGCLLLGLSLGGYFIGKGGARFKSETRTVTVKGLVEKEVRADQTVWTLRFKQAGNDLKEAHKKISADRETTIALLVQQGFAKEEIDRQPARTIDKLAREYGQAQDKNQLRYIVTSSLIVKTNNVDLVTKALGTIDEEMFESGIVLDGEVQGGIANPRYVISTFNDLRPQLLADATKNARGTAQQFAADAGAQVGKIRSANQGNIQIFGSNGDDESAPYSPTSTLVKKIRVVSTFEFELR